MRKEKVVRLGGWNENYIFANSKDAFTFFELLEKACKVETEWLGSKHIVVDREKGNISMEIMEFYTKSEYELEKEQLEQERIAKEYEEHMPDTAA